MENVLPIGLKVNPGNSKLLGVFEKLENYDFSTITKSCIEKYGWDSAYASKIETWTKQFFALAFLDKGYYHIPEKDVDEYWHRMILHTLWYHEFCQTIIGEYYHHTPEPDPSHMSEENRERSLKLVDYWYHNTWETLIRTCTQCKGPGPSISAELEPNKDSLPKL